MATNLKKKYSPALLQELYHEMTFFRRFEERVNQAYMKQKFSGFCHLYIGQEAVGVGVQKCLRPTDYMISGYRSHTQAIGKGIEPVAVMSELFGRETGCSGGKGGSMHMFSAEHRFMGGHGIVGGQAPLATGFAFASKYKGLDEVSVCYLGDAATNQGQVFEVMNMAATWDLPVLFIVENNRYGMGTDITRTTSVDRLSKRALAFDMDHSEVDGMDVLAVYDHVGQIVNRMRKKPKPYWLEALTYRYRGHSVSDPATYRTKKEVESYQANDPIVKLGDFMVKNKFASADDLKKWDQDIKAQVKEIEKQADAAPLPGIASAYQDVYAP